jgi:Delta3-Delta2-enoyl-CoA isomerase
VNFDHCRLKTFFYEKLSIYYSSGNDLSQDFENMDSDGPKILVTSFINCPKLVVALVNGPAIGIAATTAALADIVYCTESAYFWTPFTALGGFKS